MTHQNAPRLKPPPVMIGDRQEAGPASDLPVMQDDQIHWNGQPVAAVVAETQEQADHAAALIRVDLRSRARGHAAFDAAKRDAQAARERARRTGRRPRSAMREAALAARPHRVDSTYRTPRHNHYAIEPHAVDRRLGRTSSLTVHDATPDGPPDRARPRPTCSA